MNYLLLLISALLALTFIPIGIILTIIILLKEPKTFFSNLSQQAWNIALGIDKWGNLALKYPLNEYFIQSNGYKFGNIEDSISGICGQNKKDNTLKSLGKGLCWILDKIQKNHVELADITLDQQENITN